METYSIDDVAVSLGMSVKLVRRYVASGELKSTKTSNGAYSISPADYDEFVAYLGNGGEKAHRHEVASKFRLSSEIKTDNVNWANISGFWSNPGKSEMTFVDLFCGAGGLSKGLEMSGMEGICGLDFFKEACMTYNRNFDHPFINGDITLPENKEKFYETVRKQLNGRHLNVVAGGFPCQGFSMAGNRIVDDPRNSLYKELIEIVKTLQPDFVSKSSRRFSQTS